MNEVAAVYGQGLYALARDEALENTLLEQLLVLDTAFAGEPEYLKLLASHNLSKQERVALLDKDFRDRVHPYVLNFLKLLTEKGYIRHFSACCKVYRQQYNQDMGILEVEAVSAIALSDAQKLRLTEKLAAITGKKIDLQCRVDASLLGGIRLSYDGLQVDGSVQGRLETMGKALKNTVL